VLAFFGDFAPWSILVFVALWFNWRERATRFGAPRLVHLWLGCAIVLFSLSSFKLDYYLLPVMPATALIIAPLIANAERLPLAARRIVEGLIVVCGLMIVVVAFLSMKVAAVLYVVAPLKLLPRVFAVGGLLVMVILITRRRVWPAALVLSATIWVTFISMQWFSLPDVREFLPATRLAAAVPAGSALYTSPAGSDWANDIAFNLPAPHKVERLANDDNNERLLATLKSDPKSVAVIREREYATLLGADPRLRIIAQAETFGHGGLSLNMIRKPRRERLMLITHDR
jgi:4-amino-4-deoxy-L-arabinose transferase-like glycosyltransferase